MPTLHIFEEKQFEYLIFCVGGGTAVGWCGMGTGISLDWVEKMQHSKRERQSIKVQLKLGGRQIAYLTGRANARVVLPLNHPICPSFYCRVGDTSGAPTVVRQSQTD